MNVNVHPSCLRGIARLCLHLLWLASPLVAETGNSPDERSAELADRVSSLRQRIGEIQRNVATLHDTISPPGEAASPVSDAELEVAETSLAVTRERVARQRLVLAQLVKDSPDLNEDKTIVDLENRRIASEAERDRLNKAIAALVNRPEGSSEDGIQSIVTVHNKMPVNVTIVKNRLVPVYTPYYSFDKVPGVERATGKKVPCLSIKRRRDGVPVVEAVKDGELLDKLIEENGIEPSTHVFNLLVCSDSIASFHIMRQAVAKRGYSYAWQAFKDQTLLMPEEPDDPVPGIDVNGGPSGSSP